MVSNLEALKAKIDANTLMSDERKAELIAEIDATIVKLQELQTKIDQASTKDELKEVSKAMREIVKEARSKAQKSHGKFVEGRLGNVIEKAENIAKRVQTAIDKLKATGYDTTTLESNLETYNTKIAAAKEKRDLAMQKYTEAENATDSETKKSLMAEGNAFAKESQELLKEAHTALKAMITEIAKSGKTVVPSEVTSNAENDESTEAENTAEETTTATTTEATTTTETTETVEETSSEDTENAATEESS